MIPLILALLFQPAPTYRVTLPSGVILPLTVPACVQVVLSNVAGRLGTTQTAALDVSACDAVSAWMNNTATGALLALYTANAGAPPTSSTAVGDAPTQACVSWATESTITP